MLETLESCSDLVLGVESSALGARWVWRCTDERAVLTLSQKLGIPDILARILIGRGIDHDGAADFLSPSLKASMPDPCHLHDMDKAATRLADAVERGETIGIFGDYDVDGATSSALLLRYLGALGIPARCHIPDRLKEGYGPTIGALLKLQREGTSLVVTVDCGTVAHEPLAEAKAAGIDVIVLDHHMAASQLPEAVAVVNPNRLDQTSSCRHLAAVGVTFLTLVALNRCLRDRGYFASRAQPDLLAWLDLVALGTVCDVVPLTGLNRAFVRQGLSILAARRNVGLNALMAEARIDEAISAYHLGFILGPRINAGGRVGEAGLGVRLLACDDAVEAAAIAARLEAYNAERRGIEQQVLAEAFAQAEGQAGRPVIVVASEGWHPGVIGIVAARLKERYQRPAAVVALDGPTGKGSARSVPGADFGEAVSAARTEGIVTAGGGHAMAAGFSLASDRLGDLHAHLEARMAHASDRHHLGRALKVDGCLHPAALTLELAELILRAAPYGSANAQPRFVLSHCRPFGVELLKDKHVKLHLAGQGGSRVGAIAFNVAGTALGETLLAGRQVPLHLAGQLRREYWQGEEKVSFLIDDAQPA